MKNYRSYSIRVSMVMIIILTLIANGCTDKFEERNTDPTRLTELSPTDLKALFPNAQWQGLALGGGNAGYQRGVNAFADVYAQYFSVTQTAFASDRFDLTQPRLQNHWLRAYVFTMPSLLTILKQTTTNETKALNAIARIWKVFTMHRITDYYGPIPYSQIGSSEKAIPYDSQKDIYYDFFKELTEASADLKANIGQASYGTQDLIYNGDNVKWLRFANTLRLRLALRISKVEPAKAKAEAEAAVANGVMTVLTDDGYLRVDATRPHPLAYIAGWNEFRMSTTMETFLKGWQDPRLASYFQPAVSDGQYRGVRNGMIPAQQVLPANGYNNISNLNDRFTPVKMNTEPMAAIRSGEAYLLRAEGAVNGWAMGGTAADLYAKGIELSMHTNGITNATQITNYINSLNTPSAPGGYFNTPAISTIPVKFSTDPAIQREQIGTQKWLALFPDGQEAWAEVRRSGFPKRYNVINSDNPEVPVGKFVRRIVFLEYDKDRNGPAVKDAVALLGGPDMASTPLWWDKN